MNGNGTQDKGKEVAFFDAHADSDEYDVFTPQANDRLIAAFKRLSGLPAGARVADLGCGSGVFTELLRRAGYQQRRSRHQPQIGRAWTPQISRPRTHRR